MKRRSMLFLSAPSAVAPAGLCPCLRRGVGFCAGDARYFQGTVVAFLADDFSDRRRSGAIWLASARPYSIRLAVASRPSFGPLHGGVRITFRNGFLYQFLMPNVWTGAVFVYLGGGAFALSMASSKFSSSLWRIANCVGTKRCIGQSFWRRSPGSSTARSRLRRRISAITLWTRATASAITGQFRQSAFFLGCVVRHGAHHPPIPASLRCRE